MFFGYLWHLGNLRNGSNYGLVNCNSNNGLGNSNWNYGSCEYQKTRAIGTGKKQKSCQRCDCVKSSPFT